MKTIFTAFVIFALFHSVYSQDLALNSYVEQTEVGPKVGTSVGFNTRLHIEVGGFYQKAVEGVAPEGVPSVLHEREFYGAYFNYPIRRNEFLALKFNIRTGVSNNQNFVITPSLLGTVSPVRAVKIGAGVGVRAFRPTLQGSISIRLNGTAMKSYLASK